MRDRVGEITIDFTTSGCRHQVAAEHSQGECVADKGDANNRPHRSCRFGMPRTPMGLAWPAGQACMAGLES